MYRITSSQISQIQAQHSQKKYCQNTSTIPENLIKANQQYITRYCHHTEPAIADRTMINIPFPSGDIHNSTTGFVQRTLLYFLAHICCIFFCCIFIHHKWRIIKQQSSIFIKKIIGALIHKFQIHMDILIIFPFQKNGNSIPGKRLHSCHNCQFSSF